jgi:RND family efflux transporter MFP subunit
MAINEITETEAEPLDWDPDKEPSPRALGMAALAILAAFAIVLAVVIYFGIHSRVRAEENLKAETEQAAVPIVNVTYPKPGAPTLEIILPGSTQAFIDSPIYARTSGYLKRWYFDIGARVKKGDLLADIESPEVDQQLQQARADLGTAQANVSLAEITATRLQSLVKSGSVSQQDTDNATGDLSAKKAIVESNSANVRRLEQLVSFEKVYAPIDGVVTARNTDIGALIDAGSSQQGKELFHMAAINTLRVFVAVPEVYSRAARAGSDAVLSLEEFPGEAFHGRVVRNSNSIDATSRTLLVEIDVDNPKGRLLPGAYVFAHLKLPVEIQSVTLPSNALLFRSEGLRAAVVRNDKVELAPLTIGRDYGATVEIVSGLDQNDAVILDPPDSLVTGTVVRVNNPQEAGAPGNGQPATAQPGASPAPSSRTPNPTPTPNPSAQASQGGGPK